MDKWCGYCNRVLPADNFYKSSPRKCKPCKLAGVTGLSTTHKWCDYCSKLYPATLEFWDLTSDKTKPYGRRCRPCRKTLFNLKYPSIRERCLAEGKARRLKRRKKIYDYLSSHPCVDCGESNPVVLQFDHVMGEKLHTVSYMVGTNMSWSLIEEEIAKCDIRCANCHARKTARDFGWYASLA